MISSELVDIFLLQMKQRVVVIDNFEWILRGAFPRIGIVAIGSRAR